MTSIANVATHTEGRRDIDDDDEVSDEDLEKDDNDACDDKGNKEVVLGRGKRWNS